MNRRTFLKISAASSAATMIPFSFRSYANNLIKGLSSRATLDIKVSAKKAVICNEKIRKVILFSDQDAMPIQVASMFDRSERKELLTAAQQFWFACIIDNKLVRSSDHLWQYRDHTIQKLGNGGKELHLVFQGVKANVKGLQVHIKQQVFPHSPLMREQLILKALPGKEFHINKRNDKLYFVFPRYDLKSNNKLLLTSTEIRVATWDKDMLDNIDTSFHDSPPWHGVGDHNLAQNHMFYPNLKTRELSIGSEISVKGPLAISSFMDGDEHFLMAYEHASQDNLIDFDFNETDGIQPVLQFLNLHHHRSENALSLSVIMLRGGYLDGRRINGQHPYESVWTASGFYHGLGLVQGERIMHEYLLKWITKNSTSRKPIFYYNTWGMQRDEQSKGKDIRSVLTTNRILKEIQYADDLAVDLFVLDDGWQQNYGIWKPHKKRLKKGLKPIHEALQKRDMAMGLWLSPLGVAKETTLYRQRHSWLIRGKQRQPISGQAGHPVFCLVSDFYHQFIQDCKNLVDQGVRFFKWDGLMTFACTSPLHHHGDHHHTQKERADNYAFKFPLYVIKAMAALTAYEPDLIIEVDVTENRRALPGFAPFREGKIMWMNNGASAYGDYSSYRAKAVRTVPNEFAHLIPLDLIAFNNYPHNKSPYFAQRYNVNSSLVAGRGFWGDLSEMNQKQRRRVGNLVIKSKKVLPHIRNIITKVSGGIGSSPEIYGRINRNQAAGQVIAFSGSALNYDYKTRINKNKLLAVLNNSYKLENDFLVLYFQFPMADSSREAFIIPNQGSGISIPHSTCWLEDVELNNNTVLSYVAGAAGKQVIIWPVILGKPLINSIHKVRVKWVKKKDHYEIVVTAHVAGQKVTVHGNGK
jgi:hypothetical protein